MGRNQSTWRKASVKERVYATCSGFGRLDTEYRGNVRDRIFRAGTYTLNGEMERSKKAQKMFMKWRIFVKNTTFIFLIWADPSPRAKKSSFSATIKLLLGIPKEK